MWNTPIFNSIKAYISKNPLPFHMPGHKLGVGIPAEFITEIEKLDLTEIPGADNLHKPSGAIKEAQELAASAFGARRTFFLVNGSTVGLHAAIAAICRPGQRLIAGRDCHRAAIYGMLLAGVTPVYLLPEYSDVFGINTGVTAAAVEEALENQPDAAGVLITRPNYYGVCSDIKEIARIVHSYGKPLIVDEAHGAHLRFNSRLPVSALEAGADICVQSAHKTLPAFTQGAYLHTGSGLIDEERLRRYLGMLQTTSPSYVIMAYLDIAREIMQKDGTRLLNELLDIIGKCRREISEPGLRILEQSDLGGFGLDETRLTVNVRELGITGYRAETLLMEMYNIQVEMSDLNNIVCICTVADSAEHILRLFNGLAGLARHVIRGKTRPAPKVGGRDAESGDDGRKAVFWAREAEKLQRGLTIPRMAAEPHDILNAKTRKIPLENAAGRISGDIISLYPPGLAMVCPGEAFGAEMVDYLGYIKQNGGAIHGIDENGCVVVI